MSVMKKCCMWLFQAAGVLWLKLHLGIYNVNWKVFDLRFEIRAANAIYRFFFLLPFPVITASSENVKTR